MPWLLCLGVEVGFKLSKGAIEGDVQIPSGREL